MVKGLHGIIFWASLYFLKNYVFEKMTKNNCTQINREVFDLHGV